MRKRAEPRLGDLELQILNVLWDCGPSTVREVLDALPAQPRPAYTTVLTMMRLMHEKGYLDRRPRGRAHVYQSRLREGRVKRGLLRNLLEAAFRGSAAELVVHLLEDDKLSREELDRVRRLIAGHEGGRQDGSARPSR
jgi:predicted transcriptional regulator